MWWLQQQVPELHLCPATWETEKHGGIHIVSHSRLSLWSTPFSSGSVCECEVLQEGKLRQGRMFVLHVVWWYAHVHKLSSMLVCKASDLRPPQAHPPGTSLENWEKTKLRQHAYYVSTELELGATAWPAGKRWRSTDLQRFKKNSRRRDRWKHK